MEVKADSQNLKKEKNLQRQIGGLKDVWNKDKGQVDKELIKQIQDKYYKQIEGTYEVW